jgi:hypothetical protein
MRRKTIEKCFLFYSYVTKDKALPQTTPQTIYNSSVLPNFNYFSTIWHDGNKTHAETLFKPQKRAARVITGSELEERSFEIILKWTRIQSIPKEARMPADDFQLSNTDV